MPKYPYLIFTTLFLSNVLLAQVHMEPCDLQVTITTEICIDAPGCVIFIAKPTGGQAPYSYEWENGVMNQRNEYYSPTNSYLGTCEIVTVTDANGCIAIVGDVFGIQAAPNFGLTPDTLQ